MELGTTIPEAKIYTGENLKKYHLAVNAASQNLATENPQLLVNRGIDITFTRMH